MRTVSRGKLALIGAATLALAAAASPALGGSAGTATTKRVSVKDNSFSPKSLSISKGDKVRWNWRGSSDHNVRFTKVPSGVSKRGSSTQASGSFTRSFTKKGKYSYVCTIHRSSGMKASLTVR